MKKSTVALVISIFFLFGVNLSHSETVAQEIQASKLPLDGFEPSNLHETEGLLRFLSENEEASRLMVNDNKLLSFSQEGEVQGNVYNDLNQNEAMEEDEEGIAGVKITLKQLKFFLWWPYFKKVEDTTTDGSGFYQFINLKRNIYLITEEDLEECTSTTRNIRFFFINRRYKTITINFGNFCEGGPTGGPTECTYYYDSDGDGYGDPLISESYSCGEQPEGWVEDNTDCDDGNPDINPGEPELCDGVNNDCDGETDEGCECIVGDTQNCGSGVGLCKYGTQTCDISGQWDECVGSVEPRREVCDGEDNDCDGTDDENSKGTPLTRSCYTGPAGTENVGECKSGTQTCVTGFWSGCVGEVIPTDEICDGKDNDCDPATADGADEDWIKDFPNGVAAGDVSQSSVWLWARAAEEGIVRFEYGRDPTFAELDGAINKEVKDSNVPAKVPIDGLRAGTDYYYRVCRDSCPSWPDALCNQVSGKFKTPYSSGLHGLHFGVSSCWRGDMKPFASMRNVFGLDLDFFVALGDTVYADSPRGPCVRRAFYCKYNDAYSELYNPEDNILAAARASTAFYATIDDHELEDNFAGGACSTADSLFGKADFVNETSLFENALQAFHDYNPIHEDYYDDFHAQRSAGKRKLYRYRTFGEDAALFMLDTRSFRDEPIDLVDQTIFTPEEIAFLSDRTMLGCAQLKDLLADLRMAQDAGIVWKFVLVPEPIQNLGSFAAADRYEGYAWERNMILDYIKSACIDNVVFISGDIHGTFTNDLAYARSAFGNRIPTSMWDISTGPVAYNPPVGLTLNAKLCGKIEGCDPEEFDFLGRQGQNEFIESLINSELFLAEPFERFPKIGLNGNYYPLVPAELLGNTQYLSINTFGWTEFEIDAQQNLTATTWGIDWYQAPKELNDSEDDTITYTVEQANDILKREQFVVSKFQVTPKESSCPGGPEFIDVSCDPTHAGDLCIGIGQADCCDGFYCSFARCEPCKANSELCVFDYQCCSDVCAPQVPGPGDPSLFTCGCNDIGEICAEDEDCCSENCLALKCRAPCFQDRSTCVIDDNCCSGVCSTFHLTCGCRDIGDDCLEDGDCCSGNCLALKCRAPCFGQGTPCVDGNDCCSGSCEFGFPPRCK